MENDFSKNMVYGNYCSMENDAFPIDCETLSALQSNTKKLAIIALIAGCERLILTGCKPLSNGSRSEGYVFMINDENPLCGEILYHPYQTSGDYCRISETNETVTADGTEYPNAYTVRTLVSGWSGIPWSSFTDIEQINNNKLSKAAFESIQQTKDLISTTENSLKSLITQEKENTKTLVENTKSLIEKRGNGLDEKISQEHQSRIDAEKALSARIDGLSGGTNAGTLVQKETEERQSADNSLNEKIATINDSLNGKIETLNSKIVPKGVIVMWSGYYKDIPSGWALCDGQTYYGVKTPDLRNRFVMGSQGDRMFDEDGRSYDELWRTGEFNDSSYSTSFNLRASDLPQHKHPLFDPALNRNENKEWDELNVVAVNTGLENVGDGGDGASAFNLGSACRYIQINQTYVNTGCGSDVKTFKLNIPKPSFFALAFIMKL